MAGKMPATRESPAGTKELFCRPFWDSPALFPKPSTKVLGYFRGNRKTLLRIFFSLCGEIYPTGSTPKPGPAPGVSTPWRKGRPVNGSSRSSHAPSKSA